VKINPQSAIVSLTVLFGTSLVLLSSCASAAPAGSPPNLLEMKSGYEKLKTPGANEALERCLAELAKAQEDVRVLYAEGRIERRPHPQGGWTAVVKLAEDGHYVLYGLMFRSETGPISSVSKFVYADKQHKHPFYEIGYEVYYDTEGRLEKFQPRRADAGLVRFHSDGAIKSFGAAVDAMTSVSADWAADGKLQSEAASRHLPRGEKALPELENALRNGSEALKSQAAAAMVDTGFESIPYALNVLKDGDERSRCLAVGVIQRLRKPEDEVISTLARRLREDESIAVRTSIAVCLGAIGPAAEAAISALEEASVKDVPAVATAAKTALERIVLKADSTQSQGSQGSTPSQGRLRGLRGLRGQLRGLRGQLRSLEFSGVNSVVWRFRLRS